MHKLTLNENDEILNYLYSTYCTYTLSINLIITLDYSRVNLNKKLVWMLVHDFLFVLILFNLTFANVDMRWQGVSRLFFFIFFKFKLPRVRNYDTVACGFWNQFEKGIELRMR